MGVEAAASAGRAGRGYRALLRTRDVPYMVASMVLARIPTGSQTLLVILLVGTAYDAAIAGLVTGARTISSAAMSPWYGRLIDRGHARVVLIVLGVGSSLTTVLLVVLATVHAPAPLLIFVAALGGAATPPLAGITRSIWPSLVEESLLPVAFGFEVLVVDVLYVGGPLLASACVYVFGPGTGLVATGVGLVVGSIMLSRSPAVLRHARRLAEARRTLAPRRLLTIPAVVGVLLVGAAAGVFSGWVEVVTPLAAKAVGAPSDGGLLISVWSTGSIFGVLGFVRWQPSRMSLYTQFVVFTGVYAVACASLTFASSSLLLLGSLLFWVGLLVSPVTNLQYLIANRVAPAERHAEMFTLLNTAFGVGLAAGSTLGGLAMQLTSERVALTAPCGFILGALLVTLRMRAHARRDGGTMAYSEASSEELVV